MLAYAIVRLAEAFLYNEAIVGMRGDTERLREIEARARSASDPDAGRVVPRLGTSRRA